MTPPTATDAELLGTAGIRTDVHEGAAAIVTLDDLRSVYNLGRAHERAEWIESEYPAPRP